jgi:hypothetical protein
MVYAHLMKKKTYILLLCSCILAGCEISEDLPDDAVPASPSRTVLVYLGTDNNFRAEAAEKIEILRKNWNNANDGNLIVYADTGGKSVLVHIYHSALRGNVADTIESYPAENSASPATLARVLNTVREYRPAASYGLVVLSHATGWLPAEMSDPAPHLKSVILDKTTNEANIYMELADFAAAIPYKLDFILFDACFMGSVEVCYELKDKADYIVASPAEVLSPGFVYSSMMEHLFQLHADLTAVARDFYEYFNNQSGLYRSATISVVKTAGLENLATVFKSIQSQSPPVGDLGGLQCYGYGAQKIYFDPGDCIQKFAPEKYNEFQSALADCVIYKACTGSYYSAGTGTMQVIRAFSGLSVYIPQEDYPEANELYKSLKWSKDVR